MHVPSRSSAAQSVARGKKYSIRYPDLPAGARRKPGRYFRQ
jgi:hypothetical protein